ncbi:MAG: hypothetical protein MUO39_02125 [Steroidobacteraceae bacterium]|nr:hypothetical protein [Steroidobacteraceae bacterium]
MSPPRATHREKSLSLERPFLEAAKGTRMSERSSSEAPLMQVFTYAIGVGIGMVSSRANPH